MKKILFVVAALSSLGFLFSAGNSSLSSNSTANNSAVVHTTLPTFVPTVTFHPTAIPSPTPVPTKAPAVSLAPTTNAQQANLDNSSTYVNVDGTTVHSPAHTTDNSIPAGATAQCRDGTYSFSLHHRGTCSSHGGVGSWL